jgi:putative ABC transport system permease protein
VETLLNDIRFGARALMKKPGSAVISVIVLSLGIGLSAFMFSLVYGIFYRGLGIPDEDRVATIWHFDPSLPTVGAQLRPIASQDFVDLRERQRSFQGLATHRSGTVNVGGEDGPRRYAGTFVTANAFDVLQVQPIIGRSFQPGER